MPVLPMPLLPTPPISIQSTRSAPLTAAALTTNLIVTMIPTTVMTHVLEIEGITTTMQRMHTDEEFPAGTTVGMTPTADTGTLCILQDIEAFITGIADTGTTTSITIKTINTNQTKILNLLSLISSLKCNTRTSIKPDLWCS